jgi:hypothetical protein
MAIGGQAASVVLKLIANTYNAHALCALHDSWFETRQTIESALRRQDYFGVLQPPFAQMRAPFAATLNACG